VILKPKVQILSPRRFKTMGYGLDRSPFLFGVANKGEMG